MKIQDVVSVIRSKNAGPFMLTLDIMFDSQEIYNKVCNSGILSNELIGSLYQVPVNDIQIINYPPAYTIKISLPRQYPSGDPVDRDVLGAQQHSPLLDLEIESA